ncbi:MAG: AI-2E family transporter [Candidatus Binatia bacterium]
MTTDDPGHVRVPGVADVAAATAVVIAMLIAVAIGYLLLDILFLLFFGIVVSAALQPGHVALGRLGVPKGLAVLLIYLLILAAIALMLLVVGPLVIEQLGKFISEVPQSYADARSWLQSSSSWPLQVLGYRIPPLERLTPALTDLAPHMLQGTLGVTTSVILLPGYIVTVLAIGFYWTMEVPRFERLILSLIAVEKRPRALNAWHEIETKLGGFIRGQGLAMLFVAVVSGVGYALIGLPSVLALAVLAGLLEAIPWIGPLLAVFPALFVALPLGTDKAFLVIGFALLLQVLENNVLIPRIMNRSVGVSALVSLMAILAFGTLYGVVGVLIAIPMAAVIQVLLDFLVVNIEEVTPEELAGPWTDLRHRIGALRQRARERLRARDSRMGIDPATADHVVDALDQQIEGAVTRVEKLISIAERTSDPSAEGALAAMLERLQAAAGEVERAVDRADASETPGLEPILDTLGQATQKFDSAIQEAETLIVSAQANAPPRRA